ncbi:MAG: 2OG-Fe(II) oxygenase [Gammaproteobacteria bacterium]
MEHADDLQRAFLQSLDRSRAESYPFRHWLLDDAFTPAACRAVSELPFEPPAVGDTLGKRETHNSTRTFFSPENRRRFPICEALAGAMQSDATVSHLSRVCDVDLKGSYLRIEYCQDTGGFWLEPHTDIGAKLFTMLVYLSEEPRSENWGTDIYAGDGTHAGSAPYGFNRGLVFVPGSDTWHGFEPGTLDGVRKSLIVNYVKDEWRSRHELAFPDCPVP